MVRGIRSFALFVAAWHAAVATPAAGQRATAGVTASLRDSPAALLPAQVSAPGPGLAMLSSAVLPGAGQYLLGAQRWVPYLAAEVWSWIAYLDRRGDARSTEQRYRDLAWSVARRVSVGARRDSLFDYYETMARYAASGAYDADPRQPGIQPELDTTTFNGSVWTLARSLFVPGGADFPPGTIEHQRALDYYVRRAIRPPFAWAWGDSNLEQRVYIELIRRSDEAYRSATLVLGVIVANHVVSAIDALVLARVRASEPRGLRIRLGSGVEPDRRGFRWTARARLSW